MIAEHAHKPEPTIPHNLTNLPLFDHQVPILHGKRQLIEPNATKPTLIGLKLNNLLVPRIKNRMQLHIDEFPFYVLTVLFAIQDETFALQQELQGFLVEWVLAKALLEGSCGELVGLGLGELFLVQGLLVVVDGGVAHLLVQDHFVLADLLVLLGVLLYLVVLAEVDSHAFQ